MEPSPVAKPLAVHIALLRAINVGGNRKVAMADLRSLVEELGFADVRTLLQSGNLVFRSGGPDGGDLEARLQTAARDRLGLETDFMVRGAAEWSRIVANNPFPDAAAQDPAHLAIVFLKTPTTKADIEALRRASPGPERIAGGGRELYIVYPDGMGRSLLTPAIMKRTIGIPGTARNWNTVLKLAAMTTA